MKKLYMEGPKKSKLIEVEKPKCGDNDIIVRLKYCGVCMSEHYDWSTASEGQTFGHEPVGVVDEVGKNITKVKVGDRVSGLFSGSAEYVKVAYQQCVFKLPDGLTDEEAVLEPLACLISAVSKVRIPYVGAHVAVVGCGYMGCGAISLLKKRGAYVVAVDIRPESLENAKKYGADEVYFPDQLPAGYRTDKDMSKEGFPLVMEWGETNESLDLAINMTRMCGQLAVGAYHTGGKRLVDIQQLNVKAVDMLSTHPREGEFNQTCCDAAIELLMSGWSYAKVPTKIYPITRFDTAHAEETVKFGKWMKSLVEWSCNDFEPYII